MQKRDMRASPRCRMSQGSHCTKEGRERESKSFVCGIIGLLPGSQPKNNAWSKSKQSELFACTSTPRPTHNTERAGHMRVFAPTLRIVCCRAPLATAVQLRLKEIGCGFGATARSKHGPIFQDYIVPSVEQISPCSK